MAILASGDEGFNDVPHDTLGERLYTIQHSATKAKALLGISGIVLVASLFTFTSDSEDIVITGVVLIFFALIGALGGYIRLKMSGTVLHIFESGLVEEGGEGRTFRLDQATAAKLNFESRYGNLSMNMKLTFGDATLKLAEMAWAGQPDKKNRMGAIVQHVAGRLPRQVELKGMHKVNR